jgi:hypothetical protein
VKPLHATRNAFPGLGRSKRFFAALTSASLLFGAVGVPAALASDPPPVGSAEWIAAQTGAISFGYGNIIILLTLNVTQSQNQNQNQNQNQDQNQAQVSNNNNTNTNNIFNQNNNSSTSKAEGGDASAAASSSSSSSATGGGAHQQQEQQQQHPLVVTTGAPQVFTPPVEVFTPPTPGVFTPPTTTTSCPTCVQAFTPPAVQRGTLPFTGSQLSVFMIIGAVLLLGGAILRLTGRREPAAGGDQPVKRGMSAPMASDPLAVRRRLALEAARLGGLTNGTVDEGPFPAPSRH